MANPKRKKIARAKPSARPHRPNQPKPETAIVKAETQALTVPEAIEKVLILGDLSSLQPQDRIEYYNRVCRSLGLNTLTMPFSYILFREFDGGPAKLSLYANKSCTEQLRKIHGVSVIPPLRRSKTADTITVEADVRDRTGRMDTASGSVPLYKFKDGRRIDFEGKELCNAEMKCETKAKRRATLSICGLAFLDESELDGVDVVGGVTRDGRLYYNEGYDPKEQYHHAKLLNENAAHGHEPGSEKAKQAEEVLRRVEEADNELRNKPPTSIPKGAEKQPTADLPSAASAPSIPSKGTIEIDWVNGPGKTAILRGDIGDLLVKLKGTFVFPFEDDWYHLLPGDAKSFITICREEGYTVQETIPTTSSGGPHKAVSPPDKPRAKGAAESKGDPAASSVVKGIIEQANPQEGKVPRVSVLLKIEKASHWMTAFDKNHFEPLMKGVKKEAELIIEKRQKDDKVYTNIVGLKRIGNVEFDSDGKTPIIQMRDRQAGSSKTLF